MSAERRHKRYLIDGSAARKSTAPHYEEESSQALIDYERRKAIAREEFEKRRKEQNKKKGKKLERSIGINLVTFSYLAVSLVATLAVCVSYLQVQSQIVSTDKKLASVQAEILEVTDANNAMKDLNSAHYDLDKVYKIATEEYGMVHPMKNQVITFEKSEVDNVTQYDDIPTK